VAPNTGSPRSGLTRRRFLTGSGLALAGLACGRAPEHDAVAPAASAASAAMARFRWQVDVRRERHEMAGGIGASWHAIAAPLPFGSAGLVGFRNIERARGSAWGGNPPIDDGASWAALRRHASWLGLGWLRVEMSQRMYEPQRGHFDWENEEMRALDAILSWCDQAGAEVLLTQMWSAVAWNAYPGVHPLQSGPRSLPDFADGLAAAVEHLVRDRGHRSIRWLAIVNEPNLERGWWLGPDGVPLPLGPALAAVRSALDRRGLALPLVAPEWNGPRLDGPDPFDREHDPSVGGLSVHNYGRPQRLDAMARWIEVARRRGLPFFVSEFGDFSLGWGKSDPAPRGFAAALSNAAKVIGGIELGVDGFSRWSFTNRGDLDGQWQLVRTWDSPRSAYLPLPEPEPVPFFTYALLTRYWVNRSTALATAASGPKRVAAAALRSPAGDLTLLVVNAERQAVALELSLAGIDAPLELQRYRLAEPDFAAGEVRLDPERATTLARGTNRLEEILPARSLTTYSTLRLAHADPGVVAV